MYQYRKWLILVGVAFLVFAGVYIYRSQQAELISYGTAVDIGGQEKTKAVKYYVKMEYKAPQTITIQYDTLPGIPAPHPATVQVNEVFYHEGLYIWHGKPTEDFYRTIIEKIDTSAALHRIVYLKLL